MNSSTDPREQGSHRHVEQSHGALRGEPSLYGSSKSEPDKTTREGDKDNQQAKGERRHDNTAGVGVQIGPNRAGADEPRLGVDPLKRSGSSKTHIGFVGGRVTASCGGHLP